MKEETGLLAGPGLCLLSVLALGPGAAAATIDPGFDLLETDRGATVEDLTLPADFFGPGSDPFVGRVALQGVKS